MSQHTEVFIIGAGIAGAALACFLSPHRSIRILEQEEAPGYHATGRSAAEFTLRFHNEPVGRLTTASFDFFNDPPADFSPVPLLRRRGNLIIAPHEKAAHLTEVFATEQGRTQGAPGTAALSAPVEWLTTAQALEKVPFLKPEYLAGAFYDPDCWDIEVENLLQGYLKTAKHQGTVVQLDTALLTARHNGRHWQLTTTQGDFSADIVVNAAGAWADNIAGLCGLEPLALTPHRRTAINVRVPAYDLSDMPEVNEVDEDFYFKPDAGQLMVSPADETPVEPHDAWAEELDIAYAAHYLEECTTLAVEQVAHNWAGLRTFAPDRLPVVGYSTQQPAFFWLAGQGGSGVQTSPALGQLATALVLQQPLTTHLTAAGLTAELFSPARLGG